jgi:ankyrin repeat protein
VLAARIAKHTDVVLFLLENGGFIKDESDETSLHWAARKGFDDIVALLLAGEGRGFLNVKNKHDGGTPLHAAAYCGYESVVEKLLAAGADHTITNDREETALAIASERWPERLIRVVWKVN